MRILITGPRKWSDWVLIWIELCRLTYEVPPSEVTVIEGEAEGFDTFAKNLALLMRFEVEPYEPDYEHDGRGAPFARNQRMVDTGADWCLAGYMPCTLDKCKGKKEHATHGTADCVRRARKAGIPVRTVQHD